MKGGKYKDKNIGAEVHIRDLKIRETATTAKTSLKK